MKFTHGLIIIAMYINNLNIIGTLEEVPVVTENVKEESEIKSPRRTKFYLDLDL